MGNVPTDHHAMGWRGKSYTKAAQMFIADVAGNAADLAFLRYQTQIDDALPFIKSTFKTLLYTPIKIFQKPIEWAIDNAGSSIEGEEGRKQRMSQTEAQRLDGLVDASYHYTAAALVGMGTLMCTEKSLSHVMDTGHVANKVWWRLDFPVHIGTAVLLGSPAMKPVTNSIKSVMKNVMVAAGWQEDKAEQDSRFAIAYILPNYVTLIPTTAAMSAQYYAAEKGVLQEATHSFHSVPGRSIQEIENGVARNMLWLLEKLKVIEKPLLRAVHA